jgi:menaquinone-9 beta-reductase
MELFDAAIIGGGPAGSAAALYLRQLGLKICVIERSAFPRETVCGEFLSAEAARSMKELGLFDKFLDCSPSAIDTLKVHTQRSRTIETPLEFTAYGIKRGRFDHFLLTEAARAGATVIQPAEVIRVKRDRKGHTVIYGRGGSQCEVRADAVIAAYGKHSILDKTLGRPHGTVASHLNGIKFHIDRAQYTETDAHTIHLVGSDTLYCGVNPVDEQMVTVCFLEKRTTGDDAPRMKLRQLYNGHSGFHDLFTPDFDSVIGDVRVYGSGNIYFGRKAVVHDGMFMAGDAAGSIAPLAGDGMGMAFESARLLADVFEQKQCGKLDERSAELSYLHAWRSTFRRRLIAAQTIQSILLSSSLRNVGMNFLSNAPSLLPILVRLTRG